MDIGSNFYINWRSNAIIDLTNPNPFAPNPNSKSTPLGFYLALDVTSREDVYCIFVAAGQSFYEIVAAYRAGVFLGHRKPLTIALYLLTSLVVLLHTATSFAIVFYGINN
ncbi:hypothetical protein HKX48_005830 [Thoreauomyces humboldtii]|nr:hypothetical protein HKX48_005830 [Thoreauomyces humboldtii]